jgi:hypothetical protein
VDIYSEIKDRMAFRKPVNPLTGYAEAIDKSICAVNIKRHFYTTILLARNVALGQAQILRQVFIAWFGPVVYSRHF